MEIGCPNCQAELIIPASHGAVALLAKPVVAEREIAEKQQALDRAQSEAKTAREELAAATAEIARLKAGSEVRERELNELVVAGKAESEQVAQNAKALEELVRPQSAHLSRHQSCAARVTRP